ncbi:class III bacteriocin [uncultured Lactobacillus sp.]|uniref:class III bacteriocin n=1 Tax=uncultured Lactobacillus sp. TaxID=153152 RepID=UPI002603D807|nr:class III bacteriocin [uncultured Lactobacillus sp.]
MIEITGKVEFLYELNNLHHVVVQASFVTQNQVLALQLLNKQTNTAVFRAPKQASEVYFDEDQPALFLRGALKPLLAGGHTQTLLFSGKADQYFIGTKPKKYGSIFWDTQIARVTIPQSGRATYDSNTQMVRLSYMNRAGSGANSNVPYPGKDLERLEAAISPNYQYFLVASIDFNHVGHFALYNLADINQALDKAQEDTSDVNIQNINCLAAFNIPNFNTNPLQSIQGYAIDNQKNIYISSQPSPSKDWFGLSRQGKNREIVKIPWGETNPDNWLVLGLDQNRTLDCIGYLTEFEGIQILGENDLYLTVAYHRDSDLTTLKNRIYHVKLQA